MELFVDEQSWRPTASEKPPSESCVDHGDFPGRDEITLHSSIARMPRTLILAFVPAEHSLRPPFASALLCGTNHLVVIRLQVDLPTRDPSMQP